MENIRSELEEKNNELQDNKKKVKSNNEKLVIGIIIGAVLGFLIYWSLNIVSDFSETAFQVLIGVIILVVILFLLTVWFRNRIIKRFFGEGIQFDTLLNETRETIHLISENVTDTLPLSKDKKEKIKIFAPRLINYILWSNFRNWGLRIMTAFVLGLGGIVTTILILNQNKLFENQNIRIEQQTHLIEAARRSSQMFIMGEVLSDINTELKDSINKYRVLSSPLVGRIIGLSSAMRPYRYLEGDSLIKKPISPERGQLLIGLIESRIDSSFFVNNILLGSNFNYSDLKGAYLYEANLQGAKLSGADLSGADLRRADLGQADLSNANLLDADLSMATLSLADLRGAKWGVAKLSGADLRWSYFGFADLRNANLRGTALRGAILRGADLRGAYLNYMNLESIESLDSVKVHRYDWLIYIKDSLKLRGSEEIYNTYRVDNVYYNKGDKEKQPMIIRKDQSVKDEDDW